jgi:hypothetical protein
MGHESERTINIEDRLILLLRQKAYSLPKWGEIPDNNEEFLSPQTALHPTNNRGLECPDQARALHEVDIQWQECTGPRLGAAAALPAITSPLWTRLVCTLLGRRE